MNNKEKLINIGIISISDRAFKGIYTDKGIPTIKNVLTPLLKKTVKFQEEIIPDEQQLIEDAIIKFSDKLSCDLILTTGGTGPSHRDVTPEAIKPLLEKEVLGLAELMRLRGLEQTDFAALSRSLAGSRQKTLILVLPGSPKGAIESLQAILKLIPHAIDLLQGHTQHNK